MAFLDKTVGQIENGLKGGLVKHWLNYNVRLNNWPKEFNEDARLAYEGTPSSVTTNFLETIY